MNVFVKSSAHSGYSQLAYTCSLYRMSSAGTSEAFPHCRTRTRRRFLFVLTVQVHINIDEHHGSLPAYSNFVSSLVELDVDYILYYL